MTLDGASPALLDVLDHLKEVAERLDPATGATRDPGRTDARADVPAPSVAGATLSPLEENGA